MQHSRSSDGFALRAALFYAVSNILIGVHLPFFPVWLQAKGLEAGQVGAILSATALLRVISVPLATGAADRRFGLRAMIVVLAAATALGFIALGLVSAVPFIIALTLFTAFANTPAVALIDAYTLRGLKARGAAYGPVRLWGSILFILANLGAGVAFDLIDAQNLIWLIAVAALAVALASTLLMPLPAVPTRMEDDKAIRPFWREPRFAAIVLAASLIQSSHAVYYGFSTIAWKAAGLDGVVIGALWALGVIAEIVLFALSGRLPPALGPVPLMLVGGVGATVRWAAMAFDPTGWTLPLVQVLHSLSFGATHLGAIAFIAHAAPEGRSATAQGYFSVVQGVTFSACMLLAGALYEAVGVASYSAMALTALVGTAIVAIVMARHSDSKA